MRRAIAGTSLVLTANAEARRGQIGRTRERLRHELERDPSEEELARAAGLSLRQLRTPRPIVVSLDDAVGELSDGATFGDSAEARVPAPSDGAERVATARQLHAAMARAHLPERERAVLWLRYGLDDEDPRAFRDIGAALGIRYASQLVAHEASALRKLRAALGEGAGQSSSASKRSYGPWSMGTEAGRTRRGRRGAGAGSGAIAASSSSASRKSASSASTGPATAAMARAGRT